MLRLYINDDVNERKDERKVHCVTTYTSKLKRNKYFIPTTLIFPSALLCLQFFDTSCHIYKYSLRWQPRLTTSAKKKKTKKMTKRNLLTGNYFKIIT